MTKNINQLQALLATSAIIKENANAITNGKEVKNIFALQYILIESKGFIQDKQAITRLIKKGGELEHCKGLISKAKTVYRALSEGVEVEGVTFDTIKQATFDNLPSFTVSTLYTKLKASDKEADKQETITEQAYQILEAKFNQTIEQLKEAMPERFEAILADAMQEAASAMEAKAEQESNVTKVKHLIAMLSQDDLSEVINYAMEKLNVETAKVA